MKNVRITTLFCKTKRIYSLNFLQWFKCSFDHYSISIKNQKSVRNQVWKFQRRPINPRNNVYISYKTKHVVLCPKIVIGLSKIAMAVTLSDLYHMYTEELRTASLAWMVRRPKRASSVAEHYFVNFLIIRPAVRKRDGSFPYDPN